ncbi:MAG: DUF559 domain-containing protein [Solirubrobacterales bacterium]|nr:DUF559 domain-containing protein [Solirubrobacterales bacterium]
MDLARKQHGVVSRRQLVELGVRGPTVDRRLASARLVPVFRGVYGVGRDVTHEEGFWMAGVLAGGTSSVLAGRSAAALWKITEPTPVVEVARLGGRPLRQGAAFRSAAGQRWQLAVRRARALPDGDLTVICGIPVMGLVRTLLDLARLVSPGQLRRSFLEAARLGVLDAPLAAECAECRPGWEGAGLLRKLASEWCAPIRETRSALEGRFLNLCVEHGIELPAVNATVVGLEVDCLWRSSRLVVELDGYAFHHDRAAFESDRGRDLRLGAAGFSVLRFTYRMIEENPVGVATAVRSRLES